MKIRIATLAMAATVGAIGRADEPNPPLELELVTVRHPAIFNMAAGQFLIPREWKYQGGLQNYPWAWHQVCLEATVSNPNSLEQLEFLRWSHCVWHTAHAFPTPRMQLDRAGLFSLEPMTPREVIEKVTLPQARKGLNARVISHDDLPDVARALSAFVGPGAVVKAGRTRVAYKVNGKPVEEDFYQALYYIPANIGAGQSTFWGPVAPPFSLRAAQGELDGATPHMLAIHHSFWVNPKWADEVAKTQALFYWRVSNQTINEAMLSKRIAANNDAIRSMIRDSYESRQRATDRAAKNFSDYIRGVQEFTSGSTSYVLPNTRKYAWVDGLDNVVMSDDAGFNPNVSGRTGRWTQLKPVP